MAGEQARRRDGHSSGTPVARRIKQPPRTADQDRSSPEGPRHSYSVLLPVGFAVPPPSPEARCALTAPFHPCRGRYATRRGGLFSVALSLGLPPPDVIRHRMSMEPGLSSPTPFRVLSERPSSRLTD